MDLPETAILSFGGTLDAAGNALDGYDYDLQVWVVGGLIPACGHPASMRRGGRMCCRQWEFGGCTLAEACAIVSR